ncbi:MAG TPA: hypothetical protein VLM89_14750 [Phycisphaerae bacterium]|nr:hypothetical protein [Phycisphaerae bacterium]
MTVMELEKVLEARPGLVSPRFELETLPGGKISGSVISDSFSGLTDTDRQKRIWDALDREYGAQSTSLVGTLLAYTAAEWNVDLAER